ncbi:uncharacterized protein LOC141641267 [Silene latifolia]|uniref:uncharacterized protein LOC141641267 n=1 Tax=Silene latifolia TaxID=37657 RepID=UPI003D76EB88
MRSSIRCCISCILPCGSLDVIRIVHVNGRVEEITGTIYAAQILKAHPKHILKKPTSKPISEDIIEPESTQHRPTIVVVPPDALLQRGKIYFLIPMASSEGGKKKRRNKKVGNNNNNNNNNYDYSRIRDGDDNGEIISLSKDDDDKYLSEILSEKVTTSQRERRRGRVTVWRPHLESITETLSDLASND